jgi:hypothetical protein
MVRGGSRFARYPCPQLQGHGAPAYSQVPNGRDMGHPVLFRSQVGLTQLWGWGSVCRIDNTWAEGSLCSFGPLR